MCTAVPALRSSSPRGITLMEVLISIGILAIGLTSVLSLIPAGKSEAGKAVIYDRSTTVAMNALADAVTYGITRPESIVVSSSSAATVIFDPANVVTWPAAATTGSLKSTGVLASGTAGTAAAVAVHKLFTQGRDDIVYNSPATADDLPRNAFVNGVRGFEGRTTCLIALTEADSGNPPLVAGDTATLSVVVFHNRDTTTPTVSGTIDTSGLVTLTSALPEGRTLKSVMRPGAVLYYVDASLPVNRLRFAQLSMAAVDTTSGNTYVTFNGRPLPGAGQITLLVDSVGLAEQVVALEGPGPYGQ